MDKAQVIDNIRQVASSVLPQGSKLFLYGITKEPSLCYMFLNSILFITFLTLFSSCSKDIDRKIKDCYNANDTIINLSELYPEEWDTVYYFTNACDLQSIEKRVGPVIERLYGDVGDRILILKRNKKVRDFSHLNEVVLYKEYFPNYGQEIKGALFIFKNDSDMIAIPRRKANFIIRKRDENSFWVIHQYD